MPSKKRPKTTQFVSKRHPHFSFIKMTTLFLLSKDKTFNGLHKNEVGRLGIHAAKRSFFSEIFGQILLHF